MLLKNTKKQTQGEIIRIAGFVDLDDASIRLLAKETDISNDGRDFALYSYGSAMDPLVCNGDIIVCRTPKDQSYINYGEMYLFVTAEQRFVRYVRKSENPKNLRLTSCNKFYDDIELPIDVIIEMSLVKGIVRRMA